MADKAFIVLLFLLLAGSFIASAFRSDELPDDDEEWGITGFPSPRIEQVIRTPSSPPPPLRRPSAGDGLSADAKTVQSELEHSIGGAEFTSAGIFSARLRNLHHGGQADENRYFNSKNREDFVLSTCNVSSNEDLCKSNKEGTLSDNTTVDFGLITLKLPDGTMLQLTSESTVCSQCISLVPLEIRSHKGLEVLELERKLLGSGAHRELSTKLTIRSQDMIACDLMTLEKLSSSVFVDVFQLQGLVARQVYTDVHVYGDHNLELPAMHSSQSVVVVHTTFSPKSSQMQEHNMLQAEVTLPLHARYPPLNMKSHTVVDLIFPHLLLQCAPVENTSLTKNDKGGINQNRVPWIVIFLKSNSSTSLQWAVPAGNPVLAQFVAVTTATTALAGVVVLLLVASCSSSPKRMKTA